MSKLVPPHGKERKLKPLLLEGDELKAETEKDYSCTCKTKKAITARISYTLNTNLKNNLWAKIIKKFGNEHGLTYRIQKRKLLKKLNIQ